MFKYGKFCSYFCLSVYLLVSSNCASWIVYKTGELAFGIVYNDYACKGGECGCDTALKCLTNCCCSKVNSGGKIVAACKAENLIDSEEGSCCSEIEEVEEESCCSTPENAGEPIDFISEADCTPDIEDSLLDKTRMHLSLNFEQSEVKLPTVSSNWTTSKKSYLFELSSKILKVPIS